MQCDTMVKRLFLILLVLTFTFWLPSRHCESSATKIGFARADIELLEDALYRFETDVGRLPTKTEGLRLLVSPDESIIGWHGPYLKKALPLDPWGNHFRYYYPPKYGNKKFDLYSFGADGKDDHGEGDDVSNWKGYDRTYYNEPLRFSRDFFISIFILVCPAAILIFLGIGLYKRYKTRRHLKTNS